MPPSTPVRPHGGVRGASLSRASILFGGPFGRMFRALPPADFGPTDADSMTALHLLSDAMLAEREANPVNGPDGEESGIPAVYTYFGQFIDHDLTFDPASSLQKQNDPDALVDYRTPRFDLDNVYGRGPDDQPYLYEDGKRFILGEALTGATGNPRAKDLPRAANERAIIGDPRNDENVLVSQLQGLFLRFHNRMVVSRGSFDEAQRAVRFHYQWVVLNDFLPTLIDADVLDEVLPHLRKKTDMVADPPKLKFYHAKNEAFMPLEFAAAAYRFGHSMVRPIYQLNETVPDPLGIFADNEVDTNLRGFHRFVRAWALDWRLFVDLEPMPGGRAEPKDADPTKEAKRVADNKKRLQLAYKIDTSLVNPLGHLPDDVGGGNNALASRNLLRGWRMRLPSGQSVARAMGEAPLTDDKILIGKFAEGETPRKITDVHPVFAGNCPLWTYVLAETRAKKLTVKTLDGDRKFTAQLLGPVGGRIIAETMVGLLLQDSSSFLAQDPLWRPDANLMAHGKFGLRELIAAALHDA